MRDEQYFGPHMLQVSRLESVLQQRFVVIGTRRIGIKRQAELLIPVESKSSTAERVVTILSSRTSASNIGGVSSNLMGNYTLFDIFAILVARCSLGVT